MYRFDTIEVLTNTETQTNAFYKIGAIVSLSGREKNTKVDRNGVVTYKSRKDRRRYFIDVFFIGIELSKVRKSNVDGHFSFMPYPVYKIRVPTSTARRTRFYSTTLCLEEVNRPACFIQSFQRPPINNGVQLVPSQTSANMNEYLSDRYFGCNYRFCDRSLWNTTTIDDAADHSSFVLNNIDQAFVLLNALAAGAPIRLGGDMINDDQEELVDSDDSDDIW
jgi:hypothetical protein